MEKFRRSLAWGLLVMLALTAVLALPALSAPLQPSQRWQAKVDPSVLARASAGADGEFLLFLKAQADLAPAATLVTKAEKGAFVYEALTRTARASQEPVLQALAAGGADYHPYWIANMIWVRGDEQLIRQLARRADVSHLYANPHVRIVEPIPADAAPRQPGAVAWGVNQLNAPALWAAGITGEGIVIGGQDTGYQWDHPALKRQYRGWSGQAVDHNYNWHDAIRTEATTPGGNSCGVGLDVPCDDYGHGTHTMGTMVGDDGGGNQIGMAPGARWIGCRNMEGGVGTPATYSECFQWFLAPTDLNGQNPEPTLAPHIVNNSWACTLNEGCTDPTVLQTVVENVRAAGILVVVSAGNAGSSCNTVRLPPAIYDAAFSVGATSSNDTIASFSSRGPVTVDGSNRLKPDVSAPGVAVRSSVPYDSYGIMNGTSMAAPHVAGEAALLLSASPGLVGQVDTVEALIEQTAVPLPSDEGCGGDSSSAVPNNTYGYGRVDAWTALAAAPLALALDKRASASTISAEEVLTYTLTVTNLHVIDPSANLVLTDVIPVGTTFITATRPFTREGEVVTWYRPTLSARETWQVELAVQVTASAGSPRRSAAPVSEQVARFGETEAIINAHYGVRSTETATVGGPLAIRLVVRTYLPLIR